MDNVSIQNLSQIFKKLSICLLVYLSNVCSALPACWYTSYVAGAREALDAWDGVTDRYKLPLGTGNQTTWMFCKRTSALDLWTTPPAPTAVFKLDWKSLQNSWLGYKAERFNFSSLSSKKSTAHQHLRYVEACFYTLFSLVLCEFLEIKTVTGSTELTRTVKEAERIFGKRTEVSRWPRIPFYVNYILQKSWAKRHLFKVVGNLRTVRYY